MELAGSAVSGSSAAQFQSGAGEDEFIRSGSRESSRDSSEEEVPVEVEVTHPDGRATADQEEPIESEELVRVVQKDSLGRWLFFEYKNSCGAVYNSSF